MKKRIYIETSIISYLTAKPSRDPIIEEIHKIRQEHAARFNFDLRAIVKFYQKQQKGLKK